MQWAAKTISHIFCGKLRRLSRFSAVGALNTLIDFLVFTLAHEVLGTGYMASQAAGYGFGIMNSFILNRNWTFGKKHSDKKKMMEFIQFVMVNVITLCVTMIFMKFLVQSVNINLYISKIIVTFAAQVTNFILYRFWVFY